MRLNVELRHLRYFVAVAEELSFTRAAARLSIAQPPLSQQIRQLESRLGVTLLNRTRRHVELTNSGRVFLENAYRILEATAQAERLAQRAQYGEVGRLDVGYMDYTSYTLLPPIIRAFRERFPSVELVLRHFYSPQLVDALRTGAVDVSFLRPPLDQDGIASERILKENLVVALPSSHPLASKASISIKWLANESFVTYPRQLDARLYGSIIGFCEDAGFTPNVAQDALQIHTAVGLVSTGLGVALIPSSVQRMRLDGVVYRPLRERTPTVEVWLAWREKDPSPVLQAFLKTARSITRARGR